LLGHNSADRCVPAAVLEAAASLAYLSAITTNFVCKGKVKL